MEVYNTDENLTPVLLSAMCRLLVCLICWSWSWSRVSWYWSRSWSWHCCSCSWSWPCYSWSWLQHCNIYIYIATRLPHLYNSRHYEYQQCHWPRVKHASVIWQYSLLSRSILRLSRNFLWIRYQGRTDLLLLQLFLQTKKTMLETHQIHRLISLSILG